MTNNKENNENNIYVMADEPIAAISGVPFPWWIVLLPLLLIVTGAIAAYFLIVKKPQPELVTTPKQTPASTEVPSDTSQPTVADSSQKPDAPAEPVKVRQTIYFGYNQTEVRPSDVSKLESFLSQLKSEKETLTIEGYADAVGSDEYNQNLSKERAEQVARKLRKNGSR